VTRRDTEISNYPLKLDNPLNEIVRVYRQVEIAESIESSAESGNVCTRRGIPRENEFHLPVAKYAWIFVKYWFDANLTLVWICYTLYRYTKSIIFFDA